MSTTQAWLDSSRIKRKKPKENRPRFYQDRIAALLRGNESLHPVIKIIKNEEKRFHCSTGPAIEWADGEKAYFLEGIRFDYDIWKGLVDRTIDAHVAIKLRNLTQRRYAIKTIGFAELVKELGFYILERKGDYVLLGGDLNDDPWFKKAKILQVKCPSTGFDYFIRVPPDAEHIQQALAWTFGFVDTIRFGRDSELNSQLYKPEVET